MFCLKRAITRSNVNNLLQTYAQFIKKDPGIKQRKKIMDSNEELEDAEELDDLETDFMNLHKTHGEHVEEMKSMLDRDKFHIVRQKYFKEKYPNFLTWHDKEQIRYLHSTNPEEWTIERLSDGFPALPEVIRRIVNSKWTKKPTKIANHDTAVQKNWEALKNGQLSALPDDLVAHLNKFTNRSLNLKPFEIPDTRKVVKVNTKTIRTEFSEIITSYEKLKKGNNKSQDVNEKLNLNISNKFLQTASNEDTYLADGKKKLKGKNPITLHQLQTNIESEAHKGKILSEDDKLLLQNLKESSENVNLVELSKEDITNIANNKYETSAGGSSLKKTERDNSHLIYPEKIVIPSAHRKKGYTYRLNDCYYDYDGEFLYRVPGMG